MSRMHNPAHPGQVSLEGTTLAQALGKSFDKPLTKLSHELRPLASRYIKDWPRLSPSERRARAVEADRQRALKLTIRLRITQRKQDQGRAQAPEFIAAWDELNQGREHEPVLVEKAADSGQSPDTAQAEAKASEPDNKKPQQRQQYQEEEILRVITKLEYTAKKLPKNQSGKKGVKAKVRAELPFTHGVFNKAWERLRNQGDIQDTP